LIANIESIHLLLMIKNKRKRNQCCFSFKCDFLETTHWTQWRWRMKTYIERTCSRRCHRGTCDRRAPDYSTRVHWSHHSAHLAARSASL